MSKSVHFIRLKIVFHLCTEHLYFQHVHILSLFRGRFTSSAGDNGRSWLRGFVTAYSVHRCVCVMSEHEVNPVLVFAGFIASVALVFAVITSSIALYRRTRQRHLSSSAVTVLATRRPDKQDGTVATSNRRPTPVCRDVMRLTPVDDDRKASSRNSAWSVQLGHTQCTVGLAGGVCCNDL